MTAGLIFRSMGLGRAQWDAHWGQLHVRGDSVRLHTGPDACDIAWAGPAPKTLLRYCSRHRGRDPPQQRSATWLPYLFHQKLFLPWLRKESGIPKQPPVIRADFLRSCCLVWGIHSSTRSVANSLPGRIGVDADCTQANRPFLQSTGSTPTDALLDPRSLTARAGAETDDQPPARCVPFTFLPCLQAADHHGRGRRRPRVATQPWPRPRSTSSRSTRTTTAWLSVCTRILPCCPWLPGSVPVAPALRPTCLLTPSSCRHLARIPYIPHRPLLQDLQQR